MDPSGLAAFSQTLRGRVVGRLVGGALAVVRIVRAPAEASLHGKGTAAEAQKRALIARKREGRTSELSSRQGRAFGEGLRLSDQKYQTRMAPTLTESGVKSSGTETKTSSKGITLPPLE